MRKFYALLALVATIIGSALAFGDGLTVPFSMPATACTNQFVRSVAAITGAGTCASVASADLSNLAGQYPGTAGNTVAAAGNIGEYKTSTVLVGSAVVLGSGTPADITSVSLTAGDWDCRGNVATNPAGTTTTSVIVAWMSATSITVPTIPNGGAMTQVNATFGTGGVEIVSAGTGQFIVNSTTTIFLSTQVVFGVSTMSAYGSIGCRRMH